MCMCHVTKPTPPWPILNQRATHHVWSALLAPVASSAGAGGGAGHGALPPARSATSRRCGQYSLECPFWPHAKQRPLKGRPPAEQMIPRSLTVQKRERCVDERAACFWPRPATTASLHVAPRAKPAPSAAASCCTGCCTRSPHATIASPAGLGVAS
eukprot:779717-Prymnesium_polylepis.2